jgi:predicted aminopeptidase
LVNEQVPLARAYEREGDPTRKLLLSMVPDVRAYALDVVQLRPGRNYTGYYETEASGLTFVLVASERTRLEPYTWWFPVTGSIPYKSFFNEERAEAERAELEAEGYDTWLGRSTAYSTLGYFRDPVLTTMMRRGPVAFVDVLLHEMTHVRLYVPGQTDWNEQLASFVAQLGTRGYFRFRLGDSPEVNAAVDAFYARREALDARVYESLRELEALYAQGLSEATVLARRAPIFAALERDLRALYPEREPDELSMNNARLLQYRRYATETHDMQALWVQSGEHFGRFFELAERHGRALAPPDS